MKTIDARGKMCPQPLIMTKKALDEMTENDALEILIDNDVSVKNVSRFLEDHGLKVLLKNADNVYHLYVNKTGIIPPSSSPEEYCSTKTATGSGYAMVFKQNTIGTGADELGAALIIAFVNTLLEITVKPKHLVFLNTSITLTLNDSPVLESLRKLEQNGIEILVCGSCLDYFGHTDKLAVGKISNMYDILECLSNATKVIYP